MEARKNGNSSSSSSSGNSKGGGEKAPEYKTPKSNISGKQGAKNIPSWAKGERPLKGENGKDFAKRMMDNKTGGEKYDTGPKSDYNKLKKYGDRNFE